MKATTIAKLKYNRQNYKRYEFNVRIDCLLNAIIERYKQNPENNFSELIKLCLCQHFRLSRLDADLLYVPYHYDKNGQHITNHELDKFFFSHGD